MTHYEDHVLICPGCREEAVFSGTTSDYRDPTTGYLDEPGTEIDCSRCGMRIWPDTEIDQAINEGSEHGQEGRVE